jgi:hypothetical protein
MAAHLAGDRRHTLAAPSANRENDRIAESQCPASPGGCEESAVGEGP